MRQFEFVEASCHRQIESMRAGVRVRSSAKPSSNHLPCASHVPPRAGEETAPERLIEVRLDFPRSPFFDHSKEKSAKHQNRTDAASDAIEHAHEISHLCHRTKNSCNPSLISAPPNAFSKAHSATGRLIVACSTVLQPSLSNSIVNSPPFSR